MAQVAKVKRMVFYHLAALYRDGYQWQALVISFVKCFFLRVLD
jgi:hypothetical protein